MGNISCGGDRIDPKSYSFNVDEFEQIKATFTQMSAVEAKTLSKKIIGKKAFKTKFAENPNFGLKINTWTKNIMENKKVNIETFYALVEALVKDHPQSIVAQYVEKGLDKFELFLMISLNRSVEAKDNLARSMISYTQSLQFLEEIFNAFHLNDPKWTTESGLAAKLISVNLFKNEQTNVTWQDFTTYIRETLPYINDMIPAYFANKFIDRALPFRLPQLTSPSDILNQELMGLSYLSNPYFQQAGKLDLLYSFSRENRSFDRLAQSIKDYDGPTLVLIKQAPKMKESTTEHSNQTYIFGGFSKLAWEDKGRYFGNTESYIFTLLPKFKCFPSNAGGEANYLYLNTRKGNDSRQKVGLGFGGKDCTSCRIWIDEDIERGSYVNSRDNTYENGDLINPSTKLNISNIEIWGISNEKPSNNGISRSKTDPFGNQKTQTSFLLTENE